MRVKFELTVTYENEEDAENLPSERIDRFEDALEIPSDMVNDEKLGFNRHSFGEIIFTLYVMTFAKGLQYGNSWQKRGEIRGPISNMDRKYDRVMNSIDQIESGGKNDPYPRVDGTADLAVYSLLYLSTFLREHYPAAFERWWKDEVQEFIEPYRPSLSFDKETDKEKTDKPIPMSKRIA
jgi:hypothetical protein